MKFEIENRFHREVRNRQKFPPKKISFNKQNVLPKNKLKSVSLSCSEIFLKKNQSGRARSKIEKKENYWREVCCFYGNLAEVFHMFFLSAASPRKKKPARSKHSILKKWGKNINISEEYKKREARINERKQHNKVSIDINRLHKEVPTAGSSKFVSKRSCCATRDMTAQPKTYHREVSSPINLPRLY